MKRKTFCSVLLLLLPLLTLCSQEAYMGQIQITRRSFSLSGSQLHIQMEVNYEGLQMPSDESLTLTPFLLAGEQSFDLPSILINGAEKQKVYERTRVLGGASDARNGRNSTPSVVLKNDRKASRRFTYKVTVPFREWMAQADLMLHTEECGCNGREAATYDDRIASASCCPKWKFRDWRRVWMCAACHGSILFPLPLKAPITACPPTATDASRRNACLPLPTATRPALPSSTIFTTLPPACFPTVRKLTSMRLPWP